MSEINYDAMTECEKIAAVSQNGAVLYCIENPNEAMQIAAVKQNGWVIEFVENPSEAVWMAAVVQDWAVIQLTKNPSEAVCMAAVTQNGFAIQHIQNPSEAVYSAAIKFDSSVIAYVSRPYTPAVKAAHLIYHPLYSKTPNKILDRAPEILDAHCSGLGDVYTIGLSMAMTNEDLSRPMMAWIEDYLATATEMSP